jgi:hypothetical protein
MFPALFGPVRSAALTTMVAAAFTVVGTAAGRVWSASDVRLRVPVRVRGLTVSSRGSRMSIAASRVRVVWMRMARGESA